LFLKTKDRRGVSESTPLEIALNYGSGLFKQGRAGFEPLPAV